MTRAPASPVLPTACAGTPETSRASRPGRWFAVTALLFVAGGIGYSLMLGDTLRFPDERDYLAYARHLVDAGHYSLDGATSDAYRPPGYAMTLAPPIALLDSVHMVRGLHFMMLIVAAWWLAGLATRLCPNRAGGSIASDRDRLAALSLVGLAGYPVLIYTAGTLFPQTLLALVVVAGTVLVSGRRPIERPLSTAALAGLLAGYAAEVSPTALMLVPVLGWHCVRPRRSGGEERIGRWRILGVFLLCAAVIPGAWLARNLIVLERPVLFSVNLAQNLDNAVLAADPLEDGATRPPKDALGYGVERLAQLVSGSGNYAARLGEFFAVRNDMHVTEEASSLRDHVMTVSYTALLVLVGLRILLAWPDGTFAARLTRAERIALALYVLTALFHALVFTRIRYRLPFDLLLMLPAMNAIRLVASAVRPDAGRRTRVPGGGT